MSSHGSLVSLLFPFLYPTNLILITFPLQFLRTIIISYCLHIPSAAAVNTFISVCTFVWESRFVSTASIRLHIGLLVWHFFNLWNYCLVFLDVTIFGLGKRIDVEMETWKLVWLSLLPIGYGVITFVLES